MVITLNPEARAEMSGVLAEICEDEELRSDLRLRAAELLINDGLAHPNTGGEPHQRAVTYLGSLIKTAETSTKLKAAEILMRLSPTAAPRPRRLGGGMI
jgi:hypothetical protein